MSTEVRRSIQKKIFYRHSNLKAECHLLPTFPAFPTLHQMNLNRKSFSANSFELLATFRLVGINLINLICTRMCTRMWMSIENLRLDLFRDGSAVLSFLNMLLSVHWLTFLAELYQLFHVNWKQFYINISPVEASMIFYVRDSYCNHKSDGGEQSSVWLSLLAVLAWSYFYYPRIF